jgi:hypothetical protein
MLPPTAEALEAEVSENENESGERL